MTQFYTTSQIGPTQSLTPEGYLICRDVPIARIGRQEYLDGEIPEIRGKGDGVLFVMREPDDVFRPETIASFQGKPVADDHPEEPINPKNVREHFVGVMLNPRRGNGGLIDFLVADLQIMDADAIAAVREGKREVSCGYDADYEQLEPGKARQFNIIGNHVALVRRGRCGPSCSIGDQAMAKGTMYDRLMAAFKTKDAEAFKEALQEEGVKGSSGKDEEASGVHVHLHGPLAETTEAETKDKKPAMDARMEALEKDMKEVKDSIKEIAKDRKAKDESEKEEKEEKETKDKKGKDGMSEGEAEAEGEVMDEESKGEKEEKEEEKSESKDDKGKDKKSTKDRSTVRDSADLVDDFRGVLSDAEILAPGLKLPTFDGKSPRPLTLDSMCLLRRRALAAASRTDEGKEVIKTLTGKDNIRDGLTCDAVGVVFQGAVALMKDRNTRPEKPFGRARATNDKAGPPQSIAELNARKNDFYKTH